MLVHRFLAVFLIVVAVATGVAWSHEGVRNEAVKARMDGMKAQGDAMRVLVRMARGETAFDNASAEAARAALAAEARRTPMLFEAREGDPLSEAKPEIWAAFGDFTARARNLESTANAVDLSSLSQLRVAVAEINGTCVACHDVYRE